MPGSGDQGFVPATGTAHHPDRAQGLVIPCGIDHPLAIGGQCGPVLKVLVLARQASGFLCARVCDPGLVKVAETAKNRGFLVAAHLCPAQHFRLDIVRGDRHRKAHGLSHSLGDREVDRNEGAIEGFGVESVELSVTPEHQVPVVGQPFEGRRIAMTAGSFLFVPFQLVIDDGFGARCQVPDHKGAVEVRQAFHEGQFAAVRRRGRAYCTAWPPGHCFRLAGFKVQAFDGKNFAGGVLVVLPDPAWRCVLTVVKVRAIRGKGRFRDGFLGTLAVWIVHQLNPGAAINVVQPDLSRGNAAPGYRAFACRQPLPVRCPGGVVKIVLGFPGNLQQVAAVKVHQPQVIVAIPV